MSTLESLRRSVSTALVIASRKWRRTTHSFLSAYNVSEACATPLLIVGRLGEPVRQVALAEMISIEGPSLVRLLDQLCAANLVRRDEDPDDRRAKMISLTDEGRAVTAVVEKDLNGLRAEVLKGFTRSELEIALRVLHAFNASGPAGNAAAAGGARQAREARDHG
jgi:MarR family transcriptional regulator, transcriptional regulator for hemolysin